MKCETPSGVSVRTKRYLLLIVATICLDVTADMGIVSSMTANLSSLVYISNCNGTKRFYADFSDDLPLELLTNTFNFEKRNLTTERKTRSFFSFLALTRYNFIHVDGICHDVIIKTERQKIFTMPCIFYFNPLSYTITMKIDYDKHAHTGKK